MRHRCLTLIVAVTIALTPAVAQEQGASFGAAMAQARKEMQAGHRESAMQAYEQALTAARTAPPERRAQLMMHVAQSLLNAGEPARAAEIAREVLEDHPDDEGAAQLLYRSALERGELEALRATLREQAKEDAEHAIRLLAQIAVWEDDPAGAVPWYRRLAKLHPRDPDVLVQLGNAALDAGQYDVAEEPLRSARKLAPDRREPALGLAEVLVHRGMTDDAIELFKSAVGYDPADASTARSLGSLLSRHSLHHAALDVFEQAREAAGDDSLLAYEVAEAYREMLEYEEAAREYLKAIDAGEVPARSVGYRLDRLATDELAGEDVLAEIERYLRRAEPSDEARVALARVLLTAGRRERATELLAGLSADGSEIARLAREAQMRGDKDLALQLYPMALGLDLHPEQAAEIALSLARLQQKQGAWRVALQTLENTPALEGHPEALLLRARILQDRAHRLEDARDAWRRLLAVAGDDPRYAVAARRGMADWLFAMGELDEAEQAYIELRSDASDDSEERWPVELPPLPPGMHVPGMTRPGLALGPSADPGRAALRLAEIALRRGELETARERFQMVAREYPHSDRANDALQWLAFMRDNLDGEGRAEQTYLKALAMRDRGETVTAEAMLIEVAGTRGEPLADDALLLLGELRAEVGEPRKAAQTWRSLPDRFPKSLLAPEALLRVAEMLRTELDDADGAASALQQVVDSYPDSAAAHQARSELELLPSPRS